MLHAFVRETVVTCLMIAQVAKSFHFVGKGRTLAACAELFGSCQWVGILAIYWLESIARERLGL